MVTGFILVIIDLLYSKHQKQIENKSETSMFMIESINQTNFNASVLLEIREKISKYSFYTIFTLISNQKI